MKKNLFVALTTLLFALPLSASIRPQPGQFGIKGEWIYFYPAVEDTYFAMTVSPEAGTTDPAITDYVKYDNRFNFSSGYRVEGIYSCNCTNDLRFRWTQLIKTSHTATVLESSPGATDVAFTALPPAFYASFVPAFPLPATGSEAISKNTIDYYAAEALLGQVIYDCSPFLMEFEVGVQYGHVKLTEDLAYTFPASDTFTGATDFVASKDVFDGVGPEMALDADYAIYNSECCCPGTLYLTSSLRGALLIGRSSTRSAGHDEVAGTLSRVADRNVWRVAPWWDMRLGLNYSSDFDCFGVSIEAGYEAGCIIKPVSVENFTDVFVRSYSFNEFQDFSYHGPYVSAQVTF